MKTILVRLCGAVAFLGTLHSGALASGGLEEQIKQGDEFDRKLQAKEALQCYLPVEKAEPKNVHVLLCIARQYRHLSADAAAAEEKIRLANLGKVYAMKAVALAPNEAEAHLSVAICYAKQIPLLASNKDKMEASRRIKASVDKALALNQDLDLAWHVLGSWHQRLSELGTVKRTVARVVYGKLPDASNDESVRCFQKAIELNPNRLIHHIELGRTYAQMGRTAEARQSLTKGLSMPNTGKDDAEAKIKGRVTLASLP
ncbi:MAG: tetratricopeptide repeat protein [Verrucomicrobiales bacterium]